MYNNLILIVPVHFSRVLTRSMVNSYIIKAGGELEASVLASIQHSSDSRRPAVYGQATKRRRSQMADSEMSSSHQAFSHTDEVSSVLSSKAKTDEAPPSSTIQVADVSATAPDEVPVAEQVSLAVVETAVIKSPADLPLVTRRKRSIRPSAD